MVENCTQATARDILAEAMRRLEQAGFEIVGHVHDEVIIEAPVGRYKVDEVCRLMAENPLWCPDCPLDAAGYEAPSYYFKDWRWKNGSCIISQRREKCGCVRHP